ncbi:MAG: serine hydrolase [Pseudomonadota bacterium]
MTSLRSLLSLLLLSLLAACSGGDFDEAAEGEAINYDYADIAGRWQGTAETPVGELRIEIRIEETPEGLKSLLAVPDSGAPDTPVDTTKFNRSSGEVYLKGAEGPFLSFTGTIDSETGELSGSASTLVGKIDILLAKNDPAMARFDHPRVDDAYAPVTKYQYAAPAQLDDGWAVGEQPFDGVMEDRIQSTMDQVLSGDIGRIEALLIARDGELLVEEYFFGNAQDRPHTIQSITKSVTALLVGIAQDQGRIDSIDQPAYSFFDSYAETAWVSESYPITIRHMLKMSGAIDWNEQLPYSDPRNSNTEMNASDDWLRYVLDRKRAGQPGLVSEYSSGQSILLGGVIKSATGLYAEEFARETLFKDLGIDDFVWFAADDGTRHTGGGLSLTARDLLKIGELMRTGGQWQGKQVVSQDWVQASSADRLTVYGRPGQSGWDYGYQWWIPTYTVGDTEIEVIAGIGYGGQFLGIVPSLNAVFVINAGEFTDAELRTFNYNTFVPEHVLPALGV